MPDHRQRGAKIGTCPFCFKPVWSGSKSVIVSAKPLKLSHPECVQERTM